MKNLCAVAFVSMLFALAVAAQPTSTTATTVTSRSDETAKNTSTFRPTKDQIKQGQTILKEKKLYDGEATGVYNDPTRAALKTFQKNNGLEENGRFDKSTLQKMNIPLTESQRGAATAKSPSTSSSTASTGVKRPAPFRANEDQIKSAQKILIDGKMYAGTQSGDLDQATRDGLKKYQEANKLKVTGTLNAATLEKMSIALTDAQKANVAAQAAYDAAKKN